MPVKTKAMKQLEAALASGDLEAAKTAYAQSQTVKPQPKKKKAKSAKPKGIHSEMDVIKAFKGNSDPIGVNLFDPKKFRNQTPVDAADKKLYKGAGSPRERSEIQLVKARCICGTEDMVNPAFIDRRISADSDGFSSYKCNKCSYGPGRS